MRADGGATTLPGRQVDCEPPSRAGHRRPPSPNRLSGIPLLGTAHSFTFPWRGGQISKLRRKPSKHTRERFCCCCCSRANNERVALTQSAYLSPANLLPQVCWRLSAALLNWEASLHPAGAIQGGRAVRFGPSVGRSMRDSCKAPASKRQTWKWLLEPTWMLLLLLLLFSFSLSLSFSFSFSAFNLAAVLGHRRVGSATTFNGNQTADADGLAIYSRRQSACEPQQCRSERGATGAIATAIVTAAAQYYVSAPGKTTTTTPPPITQRKSLSPGKVCA